ncbi:MAG: hypothetical protein IPL88_02145 [Rhizobiales bacterium]|nr:hypothetical protein [Hyphomicrobiales bacterium]
MAPAFGLPAAALDMTARRTPVARVYAGRGKGAHVLAAGREAVDDAAAERISGSRKAGMAEAAEQFPAGIGWLPALLWTARPVWLSLIETRRACGALFGSLRIKRRAASLYR